MSDPKATIIAAWNTPAAPSLNGHKAPKGHKAAAGRWQMLNSFIDVGMAQLSKPAACCWFVLFRNARRGFVTIDQKRLAATCGYSTRQARRSLAELIECRFVHLVSRGNQQKGPSRYRLLPVPIGRVRPVEQSPQQDSAVRLSSNSQQDRAVLLQQDGAVRRSRMAQEGERESLCAIASDHEMNDAERIRSTAGRCTAKNIMVAPSALMESDPQNTCLGAAC